MRIHVLKFGGSSFATEEHFQRVASHVRERLAGGGKVALVVSGLPGSTEELRARCLALNPTPSGEALDGLIPLADTVGAALVRASLERYGVRATTLYGFQLGLLTDSNFSRARILEFDPSPLRAALTTHDVVVVPGGQGRNAQGQQTWLGKNSSDLSAVAVAAALGASQCEIYSDVRGVYSGDPNLLTGTRLVPDLSYEAAITLSLSGAKVIHHGAVGHARRHGVEIVCRLNQGGFQVGTRIGPGGDPAAVVLDLRSVVLELPSRAEWERAVDGLRSLEVPYVEPPSADRRLLAVTCGFFDVARFLREHQLQARVLERYLVTEFRPDGTVHRHLPDKAEAQDFSQRLHEQLHAGQPRLGSVA